MLLISIFSKAVPVYGSVTCLLLPYQSVSWFCSDAQVSETFCSGSTGTNHLQTTSSPDGSLTGRFIESGFINPQMEQTIVSYLATSIRNCQLCIGNNLHPRQRKTASTAILLICVIREKNTTLRIFVFHLHITSLFNYSCWLIVFMFFLLDTVVQQRRGDRHSPRYKNTHSLSQHIGALQTEIQRYFRNVTDFSFSWKIAGLQGRKRRGTDFQLVPSQPTTIRDCCRQTVLQWHPSIYICIYLTGSCQVSQMKKDRLCHHIKSLSSFFEMTRWIRGGGERWSAVCFTCWIQITHCGKKRRKQKRLDAAGKSIHRNLWKTMGKKY